MVFERKGIILAGGSGSRLWPLTFMQSKQLLPVYNKPMIYYPLTTLMLAGITNILIITTSRDLQAFETLLGTGNQWGVSISFCVQPEPNGLPEAFILGEAFLGNAAPALILGDNIFFGEALQSKLYLASGQESGGTIFGSRVVDPERYGVAEFDVSGNVLSIEEKPDLPKSDFAVTGLYFYDSTVVERAKSLKPSRRGELEITDLNLSYLREGSLRLELLGRGNAWFDTGTHESLLDAGQFVRTVQTRQGVEIASPEEVAFRQGWIDSEAVLELSRRYSKSSYGSYLKAIASEG